MSQKVIVAMSGGVDSSVAAALLKSQGFDVEGVFMKNWSPESNQSLTDCPWEQDQADALAVCEHLNIPFRSINFEEEYKNKVVNYFLTEFQAGRTPNPDVMCNKEVKFRVFLENALKTGGDLIATGHYAALKNDGQYPILYRGIDKTKDQSYFLYSLGTEQLTKVIFPLAELTKVEVRSLAQKFNLPTANKKDSQGICFIGHLDLKRFLKEQLTASVGLVMLLPKYDQVDSFSDRQHNAELVGKHEGVIYYTIGERAGETLDNKLYKKVRNHEVAPVYVLAKDLKNNILYLSDDHDDPHFYSQHLKLESWIVTGGDEMSLAEVPNWWNSLNEKGLIQVRYQQKTLNELFEVKFDGSELTFITSPVYAAASGQSLVLYSIDGRVLGGGIISGSQ